MLTAQITKRLAEFKEDGGFTENMTQERLAALKVKSAVEGAPVCPKCGAPMRMRTIKKVLIKVNSSGDAQIIQNVTAPYVLKRTITVNRKNIFNALGKHLLCLY